MRTPSVSLALVLAMAPTALAAQSFNIDFGVTGGSVPPPTYAGAGQAGVWNTSEAPHTSAALGPTVFDELLVDIDGNATSVGMHQFGGTVILSGSDPAVSGDDAALMNDALVTHTLGLDSCLYFNGLENGAYEVITYAWMPSEPSIGQKVLMDTVPGMKFAGGPWPGNHVEGVTYTRHVVQVTNGFLGPHIGIEPGGDPAIGGACNGMQLRKLEDCAEASCPIQLSVGVGAVQLGAGGVDELNLDAASAHSGQLYIVAGSIGGTSPPLPLGGLSIPLVFDFYTAHTIANPNSAPLSSSLGVLDGAGNATATFSFGANPPPFAGVIVYHAALVLDAVDLSPIGVSNPVGTTLLP